MKLKICLAPLLALACAGCGGEGSEAPRQTILLVLDAARPDRFSAYGYERETTPEMDRLAAEGAVFHNHFAQGTATRVSVPSYLFSRYFAAPIFPNTRRVPFSRPEDLFRRADDASVSFVRAFEQAGFLTAAISAHSWTGKDTPFAAEFRELHDLASTTRRTRYGTPRAETVVDATIAWLDEHEDDDFFLYVHLMDTHFPHFFDEEAQAFFGAASHDADRFDEGGMPRDLERPLSETDGRYLDALYDGSLRYVDGQLGRLFAFLRDGGRLDSTAIAITADHGENLLDGPGTFESHGTAVLTHGGPWFDPVGRVPLIVHAPGRVAPAVVRTHSEGVDVGPTLLALSGVPVPAAKEFDGIDLFAGRPKLQALHRQGIRTDRYKCLFDDPPEVLLAMKRPVPAALSGRLHDLQVDPGERRNLFEERPEIVSSLLERYRAALDRPFRRYQAARSSDQPESAFAISARHFRAPAETSQGWERVQVGSDTCLAAQGRAEPLSVEFPLPNGQYELAVRLQGAAAVEVGRMLRELRGIGRQMPTFGDISIDDETFRAVVHPRDDLPPTLCFLGFTPPRRGEVDAEQQAERLERLRTLGYVQ